ncbi:MAG: glycine--tRNA ligase subunit beta [Candidatus Hydrogenedentes bacterium]|nr:glycine--tRNA ligase subunit beta [Candidatus Hydrogenedentota bacterium]
MYVQEVLQTLNRFWSERGCLLWQPYHTEVGAGTSNPATFLRVLGPEPWWVAYTEPSTRPTDGRYGENPNRLQHYYQYQVILKPSPPDVQELFLQSLEALGLDLTKHDFRFVEDNWQSPSLGAWGLGWEAWLDGMEVLQFTYFQECGGVKLDVRACELTYGIERICMYLQGVENVYDLKWAPNGTTYGDIFHRQEVEWCHYNFEQADTNRLLEVFGVWESEGTRLLDLELILPAYDHCLRMSHLFNVLDARGAFSVTERGRFLLRCRAVAERCAKGFLAQREAMGFPLLRHPSPAIYERKALADYDPATFKQKDDLLIEIGVEELPHKDIRAIETQMPALVRKELEALALPYGHVKVWVAPRRIGIYVTDLPARQQDVTKEMRGPKKQAAQNEKGEWSMAAKKFAEANGVTVDDIFFREDGKAEYCYVNAHQKGRHIGKLLTGFITNVVSGIHLGKAMGWEDSTLVFSRPIRWLVALHGETVVPATILLRESTDADGKRYVYSDRISYGHRRLAPGAITINKAGDYRDALKKFQVIVDGVERRNVLTERVRKIAKEMDLVPEEDDDLYDEIANLSAWPEPIVGAIPEDAVTLPEDIIITPMKVHQRYIPLRTRDGKLSRHFVCVANGEYGPEGVAIIRQGNERVLNARLRDARYFWDTDTQTPLRAFADKLNTVLYHQKLGTVADKVARIRDLYFTLKGSLPPVDDRKMSELITLMKADLTTQMVFEFDSLEGVVGMLYARNEGIDEEIARAIYEHRLPRRAGDDLPKGDLGTVAGILDRFDTLAGYFGIGIRVKGTSDPFGLRRTALALLTICDSAGLDIDLEAFARAAIANYGALIKSPESTLEDILNFFNDRHDAMLREKGYAYDHVAAALAVHGKRPQLLVRCLEAMKQLKNGSVQDLAEQAKRMQRIVKEPANAIDATLLEDNEKAFFAIADASVDTVKDHVSRYAFDDAIKEVVSWLPTISSYFEAVLVNDNDTKKRQNRHALVKSVLDSMQLVADFTRIEKK